MRPPIRIRGPNTPINPERVTKLTSLGLTEQQARAYLALLDSEAATVHELARTSRVPRSKLYEVLESLSKRGLLDVIPDTPQRFKANAISRLYDVRAEELRAEGERLKEAVASLSVELLPTFVRERAGADREIVRFVRGRTNYLVHVRRLLAQAKESLYVWASPLLLARLVQHRSLLEALGQKANAIDVRVLVPNNAITEVDRRRIPLDEFQGFCRRTDVRGSGASVWLRDRREMLSVRFLPNDLHPSQGNDALVLISDAEIAAEYGQLFSLAWERARPLGE